MRLVEEIIEVLSGDTPSLENALFKAQVLAYRLGESELKQWVNSELKGYPEDFALPPYRKLTITIMGHINNGAYRYTDQPLPMMKVDQRLREKLTEKHLRESVAVIERWSKEPDLAIVVAPEFNGELSKGLGNGYKVERAWGKHSVGAMEQVLVEVRSRLLDLALQISDRIPREPELGRMKEVSREVQVGELFKHAVFGNNTTIVVGSGSIQGITNSIVRNDFESLATVLRAQQVSDEDIKSLHVAITQDEKGREDSQLGPRVREWVGDMIAKAGSAAWNVSIGAAGNLLGGAIGAYYGFGA